MRAVVARCREQISVSQLCLPELAAAAKMVAVERAGNGEEPYRARIAALPARKRADGVWWACNAALCALDGAKAPGGACSALASAGAARSDIETPRACTHGARGGGATPLPLPVRARGAAFLRRCSTSAAAEATSATARARPGPVVTPPVTPPLACRAGTTPTRNARAVADKAPHCTKARLAAVLVREGLELACRAAEAVDRIDPQAVTARAAARAADCPLPPILGRKAPEWLS